MATPPSTSNPVTGEQVTQEPLDTISVESLYNPNLMKEYAFLDNIQKITKVVWTNEMLKDRKVINLNAWSSSSLATKSIVLNEALTCLTSHVSTRSIGAILVCAWGLVSSENPNKSVFDGLWESSKGKELEEYSSLSSERLVSSSTRSHELNINTFNWMRTTCFYCAAVLRLITKEHEALVKAWSYLPEQYQRFYQTPMQFQISLDQECIEYVRSIFQNRPIIRNSVAPFLLAFHEVNREKDRRMCETLFESHLRFTGLHAYTLFTSNASKLGVPHDMFMSLLDHHATKEGLETIKTILENYESASLDNNVKKSKCTWVYSRIFDSEMFDSLQTKNCKFLAALLAVIADTIGAQGSRGQACKIKQLEGYVNENKDDLHLWTGRIIEACNKFNKEKRTNKFV